MDAYALQEGQFELPPVLQPPDSSYFSEVCLLFLINEPTLQEVLTTNEHQARVLAQHDLILPNSLRKQLCESNVFQLK